MHKIHYINDNPFTFSMDFVYGKQILTLILRYFCGGFQYLGEPRAYS